MPPMKYDIPRLKAQLAITGDSQSSIADATGISRQIVSKFFNGLGVTTANAKTIIEHLQLQVIDVLVDKSLRDRFYPKTRKGAPQPRRAAK